MSGDSATDQAAATRAARTARREAFKEPEEVANDIALLQGEDK